MVCPLHWRLQELYAFSPFYGGDVNICQMENSFSLPELKQLVSNQLPYRRRRSATDRRKSYHRRRLRRSRRRSSSKGVFSIANTLASSDGDVCWSKDETTHELFDREYGAIIKLLHCLRTTNEWYRGISGFSIFESIWWSTVKSVHFQFNLSELLRLN